MSKEIQCKCCKEYWWETNIHTQSGLCPNCYDYFADLEAKLAEIKNQTAIRELEKVKNFLLEKIAEKQSCFDSGNYNDFADGVKTICELMLISIDNQIKKLKGEK